MINVPHGFLGTDVTVLDPSREVFSRTLKMCQGIRKSIIVGIITLTACPSDSASTSEAPSTSETTLDLITGTDSNSSTSAPGGTNETLSPTSTSPEITTTTSTTTLGAETIGEPTTGASSTTGSPSSCEIEGLECFGTCKDNQCLCDNPCYAGGDKNCRDECAEGCIDQGAGPLPDCVPENPDILPAPVVWTTSFSTKESEKPFFLEGATHPATESLMVSIEDGEPKAVKAPVFVPGESHWGGNDENFVLPAYDGDFYNVCFMAVKNGTSSEKGCVVLAANPNAFIVKIRGLLNSYDIPLQIFGR